MCVPPSLTNVTEGHPSSTPGGASSFPAFPEKRALAGENALPGLAKNGASSLGAMLRKAAPAAGAAAHALGQSPEKKMIGLVRALEQCARPYLLTSSFTSLLTYLSTYLLTYL